MTSVPRPATIVVAVVLAVGAISLPAGSAQAAVKATRVAGWTGSTLVASSGQDVRLRVAVRPVRKSAPRTVVLQRRASGATGWSNVAAARTSKRGVLTLRVPTTRPFNGAVRLWVAATRKARAVATPARRFVVRPAPGAPAGAPAGNPAAGTSTGSSAAAAPPSTDIELEVARLVNLARASARTCGTQRFAAAGPLRVDNRLSQASRDHALDMGRQRYFAHTSLDGRTPWDRARAAGYTNASGENIAAGYPTAAAVVQGWLDSPGHCTNIMAPDAADIGVGFANVSGSPYGTYWVQLFGRG
jgi:uncharacterized protein YkwD